ncbi:uncharacterized protein K02A2.6-like [Cydia fagiglandana]|uniref:uncharacterized protein K02A2.6-like n=1 Tax=Cydia fagiglandana TaxID=1458189 RepID=UPI002FEE1FB2
MVITMMNNLCTRCPWQTINRHESLFDGTLGRYNGPPVRLSVREGAEPIFCRARPLPYAMRARVDAELDAMLRAGVIEPVDRSDWATPLVIASKADGDIRICADYKVTLNRVLQVDRYPVPKLDDLFSGLSNNKYFTKLDLSQAYNQLVLDEDSRAYTVINTHRGLFKYNRLVFGLASSPGIFQKFMVNLLRDIPDVVVFFDDILIKSRDLDSHVKAIKQVFTILQASGLKLKKKKCDFLSRQVEYLGFIVDENGVRVNPDKIKPIVNMPHPTNTTELKSFLGMVNFYGKFVKNLSGYLGPLYELLKKGRHFTWGKIQNDAFEYVKKLLCSTEVLAHYDMTRTTVVTCDASARGLGAILAQRLPGGEERVVAYASRALTEHEKHYSQIHKEALSIIYAVDKFHQYLYGRKFILRTDHKPLVSIFGPNTGVPVTAASRLQRWAIKLSAYDFIIEYVRTDKNTADVLSRLIKTHREETVAEEGELPEQTYLHFATESLLLDYKVLKRETSKDPILSRVLAYLSDGWPSDIEINELKPYFNRRDELYCELGCILWGRRVVIPASCRERVIRELHEAHMGIVKTKALARSYVWWPGVDEAVEARCRACAVCASVADAPAGHVPCAWPWPDRPWARLHIDFMSITGLTYMITVDACSKWIEAAKMKTTTAQSVVAVLRDMWARFGLPKQLVSDNGPPFTSSEFEEFLKRNGIEHIFSSPYHPASNGAAENAVKICKRVIKKAQKQKVDVDVALNRFLLTYRNTEHYTTGESPAKILQGRNLRMRLDQMKPERAARVGEHQAQAESRARGLRRQLSPGDPVWYRDYRSNDKWLAGQVSEKLGSTDYTIKSNVGTGIHRHIDQLRRRVSEATANVRVSPELAKRRSSSSFVLPEEVPEPELDSGEGSMSPRPGPSTGSAAQLPVAPGPAEPTRAGVPKNSVHAKGAAGNVEIAEAPLPNVPTVVQSKRVVKPPVRFGFDDYF